ncbi:MAG: hypothetical protein FWD77_12015 [Betaproteobacteria bacterium]|nr:hypothetical protein [Betaproteobacteria bacterium]
MSEEQGLAKKAPVKAMWIVMVLAWVFFLLPLPGTGIFIAGPLNLAAFILAIICLTRSSVAQGVMGLIGTLVVSSLLFMFGGALMIGSALHGMDKKHSEKVENVKEDEVIIVSAVDLLKAYDANEVAADSKFKGKIVEITGKVESIGKDITDDQYISIDAGDPIRSVQCYFQESASSELAQVSKGQRITIRGKVDGLAMNVILKGSKIVKATEKDVQWKAAKPVLQALLECRGEDRINDPALQPLLQPNSEYEWELTPPNDFTVFGLPVQKITFVNTESGAGILYTSIIPGKTINEIVAAAKLKNDEHGFYTRGSKCEEGEGEGSSYHCHTSLSLSQSNDKKLLGLECAYGVSAD